MGSTEDGRNALSCTRQFGQFDESNRRDRQPGKDEEALGESGREAIQSGRLVPIVVRDGPSAHKTESPSASAVIRAKLPSGLFTRQSNTYPNDREKWPDQPRPCSAIAYSALAIAGSITFG